MRHLLTAAAALTLILTACLAPTVPPDPEEPPRACTLIGCESQIAFELGVDIAPGESYEIEACVDGECASETVEVPESGFGTEGPFTLDTEADTVTVRLLGDDYSGTHDVSLSVIGRDGRLVSVDTSTEFERLQPNGEGCEPICWQVTIAA